MRLAALLLCAIPAFAQISISPITTATIPGTGATPAPGGTKGTTQARDTTGATLLVACAGDNAAGTPTFSDSKGNAWHTLTLSGSTSTSIIGYAFDHGGTALSVGAGHTMSIQGASAANYPAAIFLTFSGTLTASDPFDQQNVGDTGGGALATVAAGSVTPSLAGELVIACLGTGTGTGVVTIDSSIHIAAQVPFDGVNNYSGMMGYLAPRTAAINPTWTYPGTAFMAASIATFKAGAAASTTVLRHSGGFIQ